MKITDVGQLDGQTSRSIIMVVNGNLAVHTLTASFRQDLQDLQGFTRCILKSCYILEILSNNSAANPGASRSRPAEKSNALTWRASAESSVRLSPAIAVS